MYRSVLFIFFLFHLKSDEKEDLFLKICMLVETSISALMNHGLGKRALHFFLANRQLEKKEN